MMYKLVQMNIYTVQKCPNELTVQDIRIVSGSFCALTVTSLGG